MEYHTKQGHVELYSNHLGRLSQSTRCATTHSRRGLSLHGVLLDKTEQLTLTLTLRCRVKWFRSIASVVRGVRMLTLGPHGFIPKTNKET